MKTIIAAAFIAVSILMISVSAQAQSVGVYGEVGIGVRPAPNTYRSEVIAEPRPTSLVRPGRPMRRECEPGFKPNSRGECIEMHEPRLVERATCVPGTHRRVPDPGRPGGFRILECGIVD